MGDHVFIMGRADQGPFSLLCLLRGTQELIMDLVTEDKDVILHALEWDTEAHTALPRRSCRPVHTPPARETPMQART